MTYLRDDWDDNKLTNRPVAMTLIDDTLAVNPPIQAKRPEWSTLSGSPTAENGHMRINAGDQVETGWDVEIFTLEFDFQALTAPSDQEFRFYFLHENNTNAYFVKIRGGTTELKLTKWQAGSQTHLVSVTWDRDTAWHTFKVTRDSAGNWELFYDGVSQGTSTDTWLPAYDSVAPFNNYVSADVYINNLKVY